MKTGSDAMMTNLQKVSDLADQLMAE